MARVDVQGFEELDAMFKRLEAGSEAMAKKAVDNAAPVVAQAIKGEFKKKANRGYSRGDLESSVRATSAKANGYGVFAVVGPTGKNRRGEDNALVAAYLEYGVRTGARDKNHKRKSSGYRQEPKPWRDAAARAAEPRVVDIVQRVIDEEVGS